MTAEGSLMLLCRNELVSIINGSAKQVHCDIATSDSSQLSLEDPQVVS
jgi:hypothetical protein